MGATAVLSNTDQLCELGHYSVPDEARVCAGYAECSPLGTYTRTALQPPPAR